MSNNNNVDRDWKTRLEELETEVRQAASNATEKVQPHVEVLSKSELSEKISIGIEKTRNWFEALPQSGKIIVGIGAIWISFSILNTVLHLISSIITVAILAVVLYFAYQKLLGDKEK